MRFLAIEAYCALIRFDFSLRREDFHTLYQRVHHCQLGKKVPTSPTIKDVCRAVDQASIWYWKEVLCLQRSAATCCLLRRYGTPAEMVIGIRQLPFRGHAWVEAGGQVVNDRSYTPEIYTVLDRC
jgi:Transglutaminase-like superfamily